MRRAASASSSSDYRSPERRHMPGRMVIEDGWWWVPFLALFAGLRAEEALQLRSDDITEVKGYAGFAAKPRAWAS